MADNMKQINCPACGKEMKKVFMPQQGVHLDVCVDGCGGIYFDNREFSKFDEPHEDISPLLDVLKDKEFQKVDQSYTRVCPVCGMNMVKNFASIKREVEVDECYNCGGKFLDNGELAKIRSQYNTEQERLNDVLEHFRVEMSKNQDIENAVKSDSFQYVYDRQERRKGIVIGIIFGIVFALLVICAAYYFYYNNGIENNILENKYEKIEILQVE